MIIIDTLSIKISMNWKIKLSCNLLHFRIKLFLLILIFNEITNEETTITDLTPTTTELQLMHLEDNKNVSQLNFNNITVEDDSDPDYPYEKLVELVTETKRILSSTNATAEKRMLNLDPSDYEIYLRSTDVDNELHQTDTPDVYNLDGQITIINRGPPDDSIAAMGSPSSSACATVTETNRPRRLKSIDGTNQFVVNLDNQFVQKWNIIKCLSPDKQCGIRSILPEMYESVCEEQSGTRKFFSVPVGEEITLSKQEYRQFRIPIGCNCKLRMATSVP